MTSAETIETLFQVGTELKDAFIKAREPGGGATSWSKFLQSADGKKALAEIDGLIALLRPNELKTALHETRTKMKELKSGKKLSDLSADKLTQYNALLDLEVELTKKFLDDPGTDDFLGWLVHDLLPVIARIGPVVIPLLV